MYSAFFAGTSGHLTGQASKSRGNPFGISGKALLSLIKGDIYIAGTGHFHFFFLAFNMGMTLG